MRRSIPREISPQSMRNCIINDISGGDSPQRIIVERARSDDRFATRFRLAIVWLAANECQCQRSAAAASAAASLNRHYIPFLLSQIARNMAQL